MTAEKPTGVPGLEDLLREMVERGASDLHLTVGERPTLRIDGALQGIEDLAVLVATDTDGLAAALLTPDQRRRFQEENDLDFAFDVPGLARFRGNCFRQRGRTALALRHIPHRVVSLEELGLPPITNRLTTRPRGLVLVTGPTGSGKSTTLAAMVDLINRRRRGHIITIEDPIEFLHPHRGCIVNQREVGVDTPSFATGLKYSLRQDPDVILIGEMRDAETMSAALAIAETGHLVLATLHTNSAADSVNRVVDAFPAHSQQQVRTQLASVLEGVLTQILLPRAVGSGRVVATEVLVSTDAIRAVIRDEKVHQIRSLMEAGRKHGMQTMNDSLARLYLNGEIRLETALGGSSDPAALLRFVGEPAPEGFEGQGIRG
ncbi:MAG: type IV pilus twitching motility protein PilT [Gemmatimonadetes bacterium]|nr:type IV pilus twitching motility protein PilT [Gemmatimonadota bacterium]MCY3610106.1 type IV pilus twitching motility protein PilT [Gemmatimonadota bacterium]MYA42265.1 type IV pilus twitching motility protein PilT [Gemmatimonadota bacterium]MYE92728.1 type IV pilus twitching motility protein PilT [Gemmatimonadota bacterium]MYJ08982.1 type IV pilus twitching motility protein PilT [Gemmatimonadota bacterium]